MCPSIGGGERKRRNWHSRGYYGRSVEVSSVRQLRRLRSLPWISISSQLRRLVKKWPLPASSKRKAVDWRKTSRFRTSCIFSWLTLIFVVFRVLEFLPRNACNPLFFLLLRPSRFRTCREAECRVLQDSDTTSHIILVAFLPTVPRGSFKTLSRHGGTSRNGTTKLNRTNQLLIETTSY